MGNNWGMGNSNGSVGNSNGSMGNNGSSMGNNRTRSIGGNSFVGDLSNISTVGISSVVADNLGSAIGKSYSVGSSGGISISALILIKVGSTVVISNSILVGVDRGVIIHRLRNIPRGSRKGQGS